METIEKVGKTIEPIQKDQPVLSSRITSEVVNISNTNLENSKSGEVMSTTGTSTGSGPVLGDMKPKDSGESQLSGGTVPQQALQRPQGQGPVIQQDSSTASKPNAGTGAGTGTGVGVGSTENASRQIPPIHDIQIPSMSAGGAIRNGNLLGGHGGSGSTSTSQFSNFNGVGSGHPLPRAPALQDVTSGSHPELLRRSSSNISDAGVGIPRQLVDVTQSSNMLLSKPNINPVIQSTSSGVSGTNGSESTMPVLNGANMSASSSMAYGNMLTPNMRPLNQMTMALPNQSSATSMSQQAQQAQHHPQQKQHPPSQQQSQSQLPQQQQKQQLSQNIQQQGTSQPQSQQQQQYLLNNSNNNNSSANPAVGSYAPGGPQTTSNAPKKGRWGSGQPMPPKPWHTTEHNPERAEMNKRIVNLLQQRRPDASPEWYQKLPQMAKRLEEALYGEAQSFEMYNNFSTLKGRLQQLALSMSGKVGASKSAAASTSAGAGVGPPQGQEMTAENIQMMKQQQLYKQQQQQQQHVANMQQMQHQQQHGSNFQQQSQQQVRSYPNNSNYNQRPQGQQGQPNYQLPNYQQTNGAQPMTIATESAGGLLQGGQLLQPNMHQTTNTGAQPGAAGRYVNMNNLNPTLYANPGPKSTQAAPPSKETAKETKAKKETKPKATSKAAPMSAIAKATAGKQAAAESKATSKGKKRGASGGDNEPPTKVAKTKKPTKKELAEEAKRTANLEKANNTALANVAKNKNASATQGGHTDDHRRAVLKQQIQRLLLLRHASKCPHEANRCPVTTHCFAMKSLWKHLMKCKDQECKVAHCVSSRYVLSHYSKCQDPQCPVCGPVRASIRKASNENHEIVQSLNKKSEPAVVSKQPVPEEPKAPAGPQPPDTLSSAIYNFTDEQIKYHVSHLHDGLRMKASEIKTHCFPLVDDMIRNPNGYIFSSPVDPVKLMIPDYPEIIKRPMDLGTVRKRLENGHYRDIVECSNDIRLTFDNAMLYNPTSSDVHKCARYFKTQFEKSFRFKLDEIEKATEERRADPDSCRLCGEKDTFFELPNYYCNGKCASRIKRNAVFYSDDKNTLHWCQSCFNDLRDPIKVVGAANIFKKDLKKGKLQGETDELREPMVQCDSCERWVHSVCGLFNSRRNLSKEMQYFCPQCVLQQRAKLPPKDIVPEKKMLANTLPQCLMTEYIEKRVAAALEVAYEESAAKLGISVSAVEKAPRLSIRQVSCIDNNQATQEGMRTRYAHKNYPVEFPCRAKCILMFQHMDGQDVILFGMYVYEYGHKCPQPNQRRVYISYLDSVHYLRPRQYRTPVYHEILIAYLEYVKMRGFHTAHIWACPPMPKDDYIFNIHPPDQKTPKQERLRQWYVSMLDKCVARGIVQEVNDLHTEYMADESNDATVLPYLDGDYWVGVAEDIIKKLSIDDQYPDEGDANVANDSKSKRKKTKKATAPPKRSRGRQPRGTSSSSATSLSGRDPVMEKLSATIEPMKHDFFVARLHSKEYITACTRMAEVEKDEETDKAGDKEKNDKKLQEEALSSGDGGKSGKMKKMVTQTSENVSSGNIGAVPATDAINKTVQSSSVFKMDANNGGFVDPFNTKVQSANSLTPSTASSLPIANERTIASSEGDKMEVDDVALKTETSSKDPAVSAVINGQATGASAIKGMGESSVEGEGSGLLASVSKLASSFFGNGKGGGDGVSSAPVEDPSTKMEVDESGNGGENVTMYEQNTGEEKSSADIEKNGVSKMSVEESNVVVKVEPLATTTTNTAPTNSNKTVKVEASVNPVATGGCELKSSSTDATSNSAAVSVKEEDKRIICHTPTKDTEDRDDTQECEHFETRLSFLQLCQGNHYQFDQLRRAKHTSMMVLYHLHNPDAPKFMAVCSIPTCSQSIVTGTRFHCETCDIDFCQACYVTMKNDQKARHIHPLRPMPVSGSSSVQPLTEEQRRERNRSIQLHLQLLLHSARDCVGKTCASKNCEKMKEFLKHEPTCKVGFKKGCPTCKKVLNLLNLHARSCRVDQCPVPKCMEIKEKTRQNQLKQRQMDDRRRQMMNDMYRGSGGG